MLKIMRKLFITSLLTLVGSVSSVALAACMGAAANVTGQTVTLSGELVWTSYPCEGDDDCPDCLTIALVTSDNFYYLTTADYDLEEQMELLLEAAVMHDPPMVALSGIVYTRSSSYYLEVTALSDIADDVLSTTLPANAAAARKLLRDGQLLILHRDKIYTPAGMQLE